MGQYLPKPKTEKETFYERFGTNEVVCCSMQGWRTTMEDSHIIKTNLDHHISLFCIFDGHGGNEIAQFCSEYFAS